MLDHFFGDFEISDDTISHRPNSADVARCLAKHDLGLITDSQHLLLATQGSDGDNRRLIENDPLALDIDQRVRCPQVNGDVG